MSPIPSVAAMERMDNLTRRTQQARAVIALLSIAMADDSPPTADVVEDALGAVQELLAA